MKAQLRMAIASVVVIALALTAMSGITYSWFSDTDRANVEISTAKVDYETTFSLIEDNNKGSMTAEMTDNEVTITNLAAGSSVSINADIKNTSTIKTVYKIVAKPTIKDITKFTYYDLINVYINGTALTVDDLGEEVTVQDWKMVEITSNIPENNITIHTQESYGGTPEALIKSFDNETGEGSIEEAVEGTTTAWDNKTTKSGLTIEFSIIAAQGTYPYETIKSSGGSGHTFELPVNKVVQYKYTGNVYNMKTATIDFSNVSTFTHNGNSFDLKSGEEMYIDHYSTDAGDDVFCIKVDSKPGTTHFNQPIILTIQYSQAISDPVIRPYNSAFEPANVISSTVDEDTTTIVFSITENCDYIIEKPEEVSNEAELTEALNTNGKTVKLISDISGKFTIPENKYITLDLNGHTLSPSFIDNTITNKGTLVIKDSAGTVGSIEQTDIYNAVQNNYGATLTIDGGNFQSICNAGTCTINGGAFIGSGYVVTNNADDGTEARKATMTINGGYFVNDHTYFGLLANRQYCSLEIKGGTFNSNQAVIENELGAITIEGGSFTCTSNEKAIVASMSSEALQATTTIGNGEFIGNVLLSGLNECFEYSKVTISFDATWNGKQLEDYSEDEMIVDEDYQLVKGDNAWTYNGTKPESG